MAHAYISVAEDLEHLCEDWSKNPKNDVIRRGSAILRRLLVDSVLQQAWRALGFERQPTIKAPDLMLVVNRQPAMVEIAIAGGAAYGGVISAGMTLMGGSAPPDIPSDVDPAWLTARPWPLSEYCESPAAIGDGTVIKRRELIKYFANTEGGVHLDRSRKVRKREEALVARVRRLEGRVQVHTADGLFFELLSIGQAVGNADDCRRLATTIREA